MKTLLVTALLLATAATTGVASAQSAGRLSDAQYVKAARCKGLSKSEALGAVDTKGLDAVLKINKRDRADFVIDKAYTAQNEALSEARRADEARKAELIAERDGACAAFAA